jgi:hypothetical protein
MSDQVLSNEELEQEFDEGEFTQDDYGFVIGPDGTLKSIAYPENLMENPPSEVERILKIFGIESLENLTPRTLH